MNEKLHIEQLAEPNEAIRNFSFKQKYLDTIRSIEEVTGNKELIQDAETLDELYDRGREVMEAYESILLKLAEYTNSKAQMASLKGRARAETKVTQYDATYQDGGVKHLLDVVRGRLVFENLNNLLNALPKIESEIEIVRIKERIQQGIRENKYGDILINVKVDGMIVELQLYLKSVEEVIEEDHRFYREIRELKREEQTPTIQDRIRSLTAIQRRLWTPVWANVIKS